MDLKMLLKKQEELDTEILKNAGIKEYPLQEIKLALLVELGELANEWQGFKYWKKNKKIDRTRLLDEFADCLHFALSLQNYDNKEICNCCSFEEIEKATATFKTTLTEHFILAYKCISASGVSPLITVLTLGIRLGFTADEIEQAYLKKHEINYQRQKEGY